MPAAVAIPLITAAVGAVTQIVDAKMQSGAARRVAKTQTDSANYAADRQDAASQRAEAFQRQMAQNAYLNDEAVRRGNYDQWAAQQRRIGNYAKGLGYAAHEIPDYVPGVDPGYDRPGTTAPSGPVAPPRDPFGRQMGDPDYGIPRPPRRPVASTSGAVEDYLSARPRRRVALAPAMGDVGSYLRSA